VLEGGTEFTHTEITFSYKLIHERDLGWEKALPAIIQVERGLPHYGAHSLSYVMLL
jgi:hypothetical protein